MVMLFQPFNIYIIMNLFVKNMVHFWGKVILSLFGAVRRQFNENVRL
jgi:hypothetical protein